MQLAHTAKRDTRPSQLDTPTNSTLASQKIGKAGMERLHSESAAWAREEYFCPITCEIMEDPVVAADGHTYERTAIAEWLEHHDLSPLTGYARHWTSVYSHIACVCTCSMHVPAMIA